MINVSENISENGNNIKKVIKGSAFSIIITLIGLLIYSIILSYTSVSESTIPTISLKDIKENDRIKLENIINTYMENPESTITEYKKSIGKGVLALGNRQGWNSGQSIKFNSLVKSPQFNKLKELFYKASEEVIDNVDGLISADMSTKDITNVIDDYIKSDKTISFREWVDNAIQNYGEKSQ